MESMESMEKSKFKVGSKVLIPRTGGAFSKGEIVCLQDNLALVEFPIGETFRGESHSRSPEEMAIKKVSTNRLVLL